MTVQVGDVTFYTAVIMASVPQVIAISGLTAADEVSVPGFLPSSKQRKAAQAEISGLPCTGLAGSSAQTTAPVAAVNTCCCQRQQYHLFLSVTAVPLVLVSGI